MGDEAVIEKTPVPIPAPKTTITLVPTMEVPKVWSLVAELLKPAIEMSCGRYKLEDLKAKLLRGEFDLWCIFDERIRIIAAITSTFTVYPCFKALSGQFLGGERMVDWKDTFCETFDRWGKDNGCAIVELTGRAGWAKVLNPNGYHEIYRTYQKDL